MFTPITCRRRPISSRPLGAASASARGSPRCETFGKIFNEGTEFQRDGSQFDRLFVEGDTFDIGQLRGIGLARPATQPACLTYVIGDAGFVGDTLFMPDFAFGMRCDFPGGSAV